MLADQIRLSRSRLVSIPGACFGSVAPKYSNAVGHFFVNNGVSEFKVHQISNPIFSAKKHPFMHGIAHHNGSISLNDQRYAVDRP